MTVNELINVLQRVSDKERHVEIAYLMDDDGDEVFISHAIGAIEVCNDADSCVPVFLYHGK